MLNRNPKFKIEFKIRDQNEKFKKKKFKICTHELTNFEFKFVISDILPHFCLLSTYAHNEKVQC